jgi:small subunit ribosomal protein S9
MVNGRTLDKYFDRALHCREARQPLDVLENRGPFDVYVNVRGGGQTGQSQAIRHGLARALQRFDAGLRPVMKAHGFLTRDSRMVERKKPGQPGARKRFQFSKR